MYISIYVSGSEKRDIFHTFVYLRFYTSFECSISAEYDAVFGIAIAHFVHEIY